MINHKHKPEDRKVCVILRARWVWCPVQGEWEDGAVALNSHCEVVEAGRWRDVSRSHSVERVVDLGDALLVPALINAHSHIEYAPLAERMPRGPDFIGWLQAIVAAKMTGPPEGADARIRAALQEMRDEGVNILGEIISTPAPLQPLKDLMSNVSVTYFELIAPQKSDLEGRWTDFCDLFNQWIFECPGISPHAPYTVCADAWTRVERGRLPVKPDWNLPLPQCIHCCETQEEVEMFREGRGALLEFMRLVGVLENDWTPPHMSPVRWLDSLDALDDRTLLVHCNYVDDVDIGIIRRNDCSVVVCPGTHAWFEHDPHPFRRLLDAGINVCLGTDSLASNESLSMKRELEFAKKMLPDLSLKEGLKMITQNAARGLCRLGRCGSLEKGKRGLPARVIPVEPGKRWQEWPIEDVQFKCSLSEMEWNRIIDSST